MKDDNATKVLKKVHAELNPEVPFDLVEAIYEVQKQFLFDKDRERPLEAIRVAVEDHVTAQERTKA